MRRAFAVAMLAMVAVVVAAQMIVDSDAVDEAFEALHARLQVNSPPGYRFDVSLGGDGRESYRLGEPIPIRLEFGPGRWISEQTRPDETEWDWIIVESMDRGGDWSDAMAGEFALDVAPALACAYVERISRPFAIETFLNC